MWLLKRLKGLASEHHLEEEDEYPSQVISRIIDSETRGYLNV